MTTLAGLIAVTLADSGVVPLQLIPSVHQLQSTVNRLLKTFGRLVPTDTIGNLLTVNMFDLIQLNDRFSVSVLVCVYVSFSLLDLRASRIDSL